MGMETNGRSTSSEVGEVQSGLGTSGWCFIFQAFLPSLDRPRSYGEVQEHMSYLTTPNQDSGL